MHFPAKLTSATLAFATLVASDTNPDLGGGVLIIQTIFLVSLVKSMSVPSLELYDLRRPPPLDIFVISRTAVVRIVDD